jgi:hypothetical protein
LDPIHKTLFRIATGDNWTDIMYVAQYGCKAYPSHDLAALAMGVMHTGDADDACPTPEAGGAFAVFYFVAFFILGGLVFLNLFIGVVTAGMGDSIGAMDEDAMSDFVVERLQVQYSMHYTHTIHTTHTVLIHCTHYIQTLSADAPDWE